MSIGIDLGTTNSVVAYRKGGNALTIPVQNRSSMPSVVYFRDAEEVEVGVNAQARLLIDPDHAIRSAKRFMGDLEKYWTMYGSQITPIDVASHILQTLKSTAEVALGEDISEAVITVPAYFNGLQKGRTKVAAELAGLNVLELLKESTAAAIAYGVNQGKDQTVVVYDLGGGTFDVTILEITGNKFIERAIDGDTFLGGDDFNEALRDQIIKEFEGRYKSIVLSRQDEKKINESAENIKIELSAVKRASETIVLGENRVLDFEIKRSEYEDLIRDKVEESISITKRAISKAKLDIDDVGRIILVGGATKTPLVTELLAQAIKMPFRSDNVDEAVAHGAAIRASELAGTQKESQGPPLDLERITPFNLGLRAESQFNRDQFSIMIPEQTKIPTEVNKVFTTTEDNQTAVPIGVFQGFGDNWKDVNVNFIGGFILEGIPKAKAGKPDIQVKFRLNENDVLEVFASCENVSSEPIELSVNETKKFSEIYDSLGPLAVVLCIDVSWSMEGTPLIMAQKASNAFIDEKSPSNTLIGCVGFGTKANIASNLTENFSLARKAVEKLEVEGSTNMGSGLKSSLDVLKTAPEGYRKQIILLTDGYPDSQGKVRRMIRRIRAGNVNVHTVGAGKNYDKTLLEKLSSKTGGVFVPADDIDSLVEVFLSLAEK